MNTEEKILEALVQMQDEQKLIRADMADMRAGMADMRADMAEMQKTLTRVALTQENIVLKGLDALAEGQDLTHQRLNSLAGKDELAELRDEVRLMRSVIAQHSRDIEALKSAQ